MKQYLAKEHLPSMFLGITSSFTESLFMVSVTQISKQVKHMFLIMKKSN